MKKIIYFLALSVVLMAADSVFASIVPKDYSRVKYFYVFGPNGNTDLGAQGTEQLLYIDVPKETQGQVLISIYDPDTGDNLDLNPDFNGAWDTVTEFAVYGKNGALLDKEKFGEFKFYNRNYFDFGPYAKDRGEDVGGFYRFKLVANAISGKDENLFCVKILPEDAEAFTYDISFRLLEEEGEKMYFYPEVQAGTQRIIVENYDIDIDGGRSALYDPESKKWSKLNDSSSGQWAQTPIEVNAGRAERLEYVLTKKTQKYANAAIRVRDDKGNLLPIYFRESRPPLIVAEEPLPEAELFTARKCNDKLIFDATKSYDPGKRRLAYFWDFGDGTTSNEPVVTHVYEKVGEYNVKLLVRNDSGLECDNAEVSQVVKVNSAPRVFVNWPKTVCPGQEFIFDASETKDNTPETLSYHWDFGDGTTAEGARVTKVYERSGRYRINLTVDDNAGSPCSSVTKGMIITVKEAPLADAGADVEACLSNNQEYKVEFCAGRSRNADMANLNYRWDFGDGTCAEGRAVSHIYEKGGVYHVKLVVDDGSGLPCSSASDTVTVALHRQPVAKAGSDMLIDVGSEASFDGSNSYCEDNASLQYRWDFGDGSPLENAAKVAHVYKKGGSYKVLLTVDDNQGKKCSTATDSITVRVNNPPVAGLARVSRACTGKEVDFDATDSKDLDGDALKYSWDFGDGTVIEGGPRVKHVYRQAGEYNVSVTVDDQTGIQNSQANQSMKIRVSSPPIANAGPNLVCCVNKRSVFDGSGSSGSDPNSLTYSWDFGDGGTAQGETVSHRYTKPGKYTVVLTVKDNSGADCGTSTDSFTATVSDKPVSVMEVKEE
jgi:PKD repeat protein